MSTIEAQHKTEVDGVSPSTRANGSETPRVLRSGAPAHSFTDEDRKRAVEKRREKTETARQAKLEALVPKAYKVVELAMDSAAKSGEVDARALDAAKFTWEQVHGRATQRVETSDTTAQSPFDRLTEQERDEVIRTMRARLASAEKPEAA